MSNSQEIALWIIAICLLVQTALSIKSHLMAKKSLTRFDGLRNKNVEHETIRKAIDSGQYDKALKLSLDRQQTHPGDSYGWFYAGQCYYHLKNWGKAREQFQEAQRLNPFWEKEWTGPYLQAIERQK